MSGASASERIVREHIEAFLAQDTARATTFLDPHLVWDGARTGGMGRSVTAYGPDALLEAVSSYRGAFSSYGWEVDRIEEVGGGTVIAEVVETGLGRASGVPVTRAFAAVYTVIDAKIVRITLFRSGQGAREAVGHGSRARGGWHGGSKG